MQARRQPRGRHPEHTKVSVDTDSRRREEVGARGKPQSRVLRLKEVCKATGLGRSFIYELQAEQRFPPSIKIDVRAVGWLEGEVQQWLNTRVQINRSNL